MKVPMPPKAQRDHSGITADYSRLQRRHSRVTAAVTNAFTVASQRDHSRITVESQRAMTTPHEQHARGKYVPHHSHVDKDVDKDVDKVRANVWRAFAAALLRMNMVTTAASQHTTIASQQTTAESQQSHSRITGDYSGITADYSGITAAGLRVQSGRHSRITADYSRLQQTTAD